MSQPKQLSAFPIAGGEDTISLTVTPIGDPNAVVFSLETSSNIDWWKGLTLYSASGSILSKVTMQDSDHGPKPFAAMPSDLVGAKLVLLKAKWPWQYHVHMYEMENLSGLGGKSFQFLWQRDNDGSGPLQGFFEDLSGLITAVADVVATGVEVAVGTVAEVLGFVIEYAGNLIASSSDFIGDLLGGIPGVGGFLKGAFHWAGTVASAAFDWAATSIRASFTGVASLIAGSLRIGGGIAAWNTSLIEKGITGSTAGVVGSVIAVVAKSIASIQATLFMQMGERELTLSEKEMLARVYRSSINLEVIRVIDGFAGIFSATNGAFTLGNKIYMKKFATTFKEPYYRQSLVHECCHVWQHQHIGTRYIADALLAQQTPGTRPDAGYIWEDEFARGNFRWRDFNKEAQARFLEDVFTGGQHMPKVNPDGDFYTDDPIGSNVTFSATIEGTNTDCTAFARESVAYVRGAQWPVSRP